MKRTRRREDGGVQEGGGARKRSKERESREEEEDEGGERGGVNLESSEPDFDANFRGLVAASPLSVPDIAYVSTGHRVWGT